MKAQQIVKNKDFIIKNYSDSYSFNESKNLAYELNQKNKGFSFELRYIDGSIYIIVRFKKLFKLKFNITKLLKSFLTNLTNNTNELNLREWN